jgi:tRNA(Ile2) C34 agmatinyltransferase TiaS
MRTITAAALGDPGEQGEIDGLAPTDYYDRCYGNDTPECPCCGGDGVPLGTLGLRTHVRCRACGYTYSNGGAA